MCDQTSNSTSSSSSSSSSSAAVTVAAAAAEPPRISLMAIGELRDVLTALELGHGPTALAGLMAIDATSWKAMEQRLAAVGGDLRTVLLAASAGAPILHTLV